MPTSLWTADWSSFVEHRTARRGSPPSAFLKAAWFFIWLYQVVSYEYVTWLIMRGYKREDLGFGDFPRAQKADSAADLSDAILANWNKEVEAAAKKNRKPSMWRVIRWTFGPRYIVCVILACCGCWTFTTASL